MPPGCEDSAAARASAMAGWTAKAKRTGPRGPLAAQTRALGMVCKVTLPEPVNRVLSRMRTGRKTGAL